MIREGGGDGEFRPWHYICVCSIESRLMMRVRSDSAAAFLLALLLAPLLLLGFHVAHIESTYGISLPMSPPPSLCVLQPTTTRMTGVPPGAGGGSASRHKRSRANMAHIRQSISDIRSQCTYQAVKAVYLRQSRPHTRQSRHT